MFCFLEVYFHRALCPFGLLFLFSLVDEINFSLPHFHLDFLLEYPETEVWGGVIPYTSLCTEYVRRLPIILDTLFIT